MSDATLYREFRVDERNVASITLALRAFWAGAVMPLVTGGRRVLLIVTDAQAKRNSAQNRRYWGLVLKTIAEQAWVNGQQFNADTWHEYLARKFGVCEDVTLPDGEIITRRKSTTNMSVSEFATYMDHCEAYAAQELGVVWE